jgi:hypothetical protein
MTMKFTTITDAEVERRLDNLRSYQAQVAASALAEVTEAHNPMIDAMGTDAEVAARAVADLHTIAAKAEKAVTARAVSTAVDDYHRAWIETASPPTRIIAHRIPWPDQKTRPNRAGLSLRWRCSTEEGVLLVESTDHPLADSAAVLSLSHGLPDDHPITLRHEGKGYDSFGPMRLGAAAAHGFKRIKDRARLRDMREAKST